MTYGQNCLHKIRMEIIAIAAVAFTQRFVAGRIKHKYFEQFAVICVTMVVMLMFLRVIRNVAVIA